MKHNLKVGQSLWNVNGKEYKISSIGNKYLHLDDISMSKVVIETLRTYYPKYQQFEIQLYTSIEEVKDLQEYNKLSTEIRKRLSAYGTYTLSLEQLRIIHQTIFQ